MSGFMKCWGLNSELCIWLYQLRHILWSTFYILIKSTLICFHLSTFSITLKILQTQDHVDFPLCFISIIFASLWLILTKILGKLQSSYLCLFSCRTQFHYSHCEPDVSLSIGLPLCLWQNQRSVVLCFNLSSVLFCSVYLLTHSLINTTEALDGGSGYMCLPGICLQLYISAVGLKTDAGFCWGFSLLYIYIS